MNFGKEDHCIKIEFEWRDIFKGSKWKSYNINFEYYNPAKIIFGAGSQKKLKYLLKAEGVTSLLLVYSGDFIKNLGIYQEVQTAAEELEISFIKSSCQCQIFQIGSL